MIIHHARIFKAHARTFKAVRMFSTIVGHTGREYSCQKTIHRNPRSPEYDIQLALCNRIFVVKPVSRSIFDLLQKFKDEFGNNPRLRMHVDDNRAENVLVYEYFKCDLLALVQNYPPVPLTAKKAILKEVGLGLNDIHNKNWIHLDVKPDNIFLNWHVDEKDHFHLHQVALGNMDCALKLKGQKLLNHKIGNVMWRSPEGQLGKGVGKHSEVFSFGLLCLFVITGAECFHPDFETLDVDPECVILYRFLSAFGPLPDALIEHVDDNDAEVFLRALWQDIAENESNEFFEQWSPDIFPNLDQGAKRLISRMTNLDPAKRASMSEIVTDPYWN